MKNKILNLICFLIISVSFNACDDGFLDRIPEAALNNETYWNSEASLKIYNNGIYNEAGGNFSYYFLLGYFSAPFQSGYYGMAWEDCMSDNAAPLDNSLNDYQIIATGQHVVPDYPDKRGWNWSLLYRINFFLENYNKTPVADETKNMYAGEVRLFRAWFYFDKVKHFGDVPWINETLNLDSEMLYAPRDSRSDVMAHVLEDINFAIAHLPEAWPSDEARFNRWAALALKSRIALYEGTYQKYHNQGGSADKWFQEAVNSAEEIIMNGPFSLYTTGDIENDYNMLFRQVDLHKVSEAIGFRKYVTGVFAHRYVGYERARRNGLTKDLAEDYLCTDGKPISLSSVYKGDENIYDFFSNRDPRLRQICLHPDDTEKYLIPSDVKAKDEKLNYPRFSGMTGGWLTTTGYTMIKYFDVEEYFKGFGKEENDALLFRLGEVLLNYAEAKAELGNLTQMDLDLSINKLRERVGMPFLNLDVEMDPKYADTGLSAILLEIRRERRIELAFEGFRYDDLMRWAWGDRLENRVLGMRVEGDINDQYPNAQINTINLDGKNYVDVYKGSRFENRIFDPSKHYLFPIAKTVIAQNPAIEQNPGW